jgi:hypothetical protein
MERVIATFHTERSEERLSDGDAVVVEQRGEETVARKVPRVDSREPISGFAELAAAFRAAAERKR